MFYRLPIISSSGSGFDLLNALIQANDNSALIKFSLALSQCTRSRHVYLTNSGISSFYVILKALKVKSSRNEIILPAYTAGSLVVAVRKAGLKPVLCDISLSDFNIDSASLLRAVSKNTLAVVAVHMFGICIEGIECLREAIPRETFLIEDCAQAMGSRVKGMPVGSFGDVSFFSFNRGKNISLYEGGCIATNSGKLAEEIDSAYKKFVKEPGLASNIANLAKIFMFSLATNPFIYCVAYPLIYPFKMASTPKDFSISKISNFQAALGLRLLEGLEYFSYKRHQNGMFVIRALKDVKGLILPNISHNSLPVFNRIPVVFADPDKRKNAQKRLWLHGIDSSRMYGVALHKMFELGYGPNDFPNANYLAEHLLTLPVHTLARQQDILRMADIIRDI